MSGEAGIHFQLDDEEALGWLGKLQRAAERPRAAMDALGAHFVYSTQRNIERETAPDGSPWPRLSPRTAAQRLGKKRRGALRGYDHILRVTARLYKSITYEATDTTVEWGSNVEYARVHQLGGTIEIPPRTATIRLKRVRRKGLGLRNRFVRAGTKNADERSVSIRGHQVTIPARPYLGISAYDQEEVPKIVVDHLLKEAGGGEA